MSLQKSKNGSDRLSSARQIHREVCGILLSSLDSLQQAHLEFSDLLNTPVMGMDRIKAKLKVTDCRKRLQQLSDFAKVSTGCGNLKWLF